MLKFDLNKELNTIGQILFCHFGLFSPPKRWVHLLLLRPLCQTLETIVAPSVKNFVHLCFTAFYSPVSRSFLFSKEGNPNKRNVHNETCLHVLCQGPMILLLSAGALSPRLARPERDEQLRADCLQVRVHCTNICLEAGLLKLCM